MQSLIAHNCSSSVGFLWIFSILFGTLTSVNIKQILFTQAYCWDYMGVVFIMFIKHYIKHYVLILYLFVSFWYFFQHVVQTLARNYILVISLGAESFVLCILTWVDLFYNLYCKKNQKIIENSASLKSCEIFTVNILSIYNMYIYVKKDISLIL